MPLRPFFFFLLRHQLLTRKLKKSCPVYDARFLVLVSHRIVFAKHANRCVNLPTVLRYHRDTRGGGWSRDGCKLETSNVTHTVCACTHMTAFAVLSDLNLQVRVMNAKFLYAQRGNVLVICNYLLRGNLMVSAWISDREVWVRALARSLCCVLGLKTLLSQCLSPPRSINGYRRTVRKT